MENLQRQLDNAERRIVVLERICMQQEIEITKHHKRICGIQNTHAAHVGVLTELARRSWPYKLAFWIRKLRTK